MGLLDFFKAGERHPDPKVRLEAVQGLDDQRQLAAMARTDDSPRVRMAAVAKVKDEELLAEVARDAEELDVRLAAVERIDNERLLAGIIKARKNYELMGACFARITDRQVLEEIANDSGYNPAARRMAVDQFADESFLSDLGATPAPEGDGEEDSRTSESAIEAMLRDYGDVRVVRAIGRFRRSEKALRALGTIARREGECGDLAVEYLVRALGSSNESVSRCAADELAAVRRPGLVDQLVRAMDDQRLAEPVRRLLERLDTPEARDALGLDRQ